MTLLVLLIVVAIAAGAAAAVTWRLAESESRRARAVMLGLAVAIGGGLLVALLAWLTQGDTGLVGIDDSVASWGGRHGSTAATDVLETLSDLGQPLVIAVLAIVLGVVETIRTRSVWVIPFLFVVVAGNGLLTTTAKDLADRARPTLNPIAETLGPSFPSGHSSWSAAFFAAAAVLLCRGRSRQAQAAIAGVAAGLAVMVAGTRVLLDVHWLSDVIAGLVLGSAWFCLCAVAFGRRLPRVDASRPSHRGLRRHSVS